MAALHCIFCLRTHHNNYHILMFRYQFTNSSSRLKLFSLPLKGNLPLGRLPLPLPSQWKGGIPQAMLCETGTLGTF